MRRQSFSASLAAALTFSLSALCALSASSAMEPPAPASVGRVAFLDDSVPGWAVRGAAFGVWTELADGGEYAFDADTRETFDAGSIVFDAFASELEYERAPGTLGLGAVLRGQIDPPVVSPTTQSATQYGYKTYTYEAAQNSSVNPPATFQDPTTFRKLFKYQQDCSGSFTYIPRNNGGLGVIEGGGGLYFAVPCETLRGANINQGVFRLTPSFNYTGFQSPKGKDIGIDLPNNVFDAGLDTSFSVNVNDFEGTIAVQVGVASEFKKLTGDTVYVRGRAEGSLPVTDDRKVRVLGGVGYYNRIKYKLVPIAGVVWKPNETNEFRLVFPDPMWGRFLRKVNDVDWWFFVRGDIGGGKWLVTDFEHKVNNKATYNFDYNDYRVSTGLRFQCPKGLVGSFEVGGAFGREVRTKAGVVYKPKSAVELSVGLFY